MRRLLGFLLATGLVLPSGADEAPAQAAACSACHGANGVSVQADIPNLAAQKEGYLVKQLEAFRAKQRENPLMNAIAAQLSDGDISALATHFSRLPGAGSGAASSSPIAAATATRLAFPAGYRDTFTRYTTINFPDRNQVRDYLANDVALQAARDGRPLPDGAYLLVEIYAAKLDDAKRPVTGADGFFVKDKLSAYTAMAAGPGWGDGVPELLRNGSWNYAVFKADGTLREGMNFASCYACHKPLDQDSYVFSLEALRAKARN